MFSKINLTKEQCLFIFFFFIAFLLWMSVFFFGGSKYADESTHSRQIARFVKGNFDVLSDLTTLPGYHATIAVIAELIPNAGSDQFRVISFLISLISLWIFFLVAKKLNAKDPYVKTIQFLFLPVSFYYFPLIYTDIFSLLLILISFYFAVNKKYAPSAFFSLASLLVRQNNIVWVAFIWLYTYVNEFGFSFLAKNILTYARKTIGFLFIFFAFVLFVFLNNGVAIGDREQQQVGFHLGNIYFFLALCSALFLPLLSATIFKIKREDLKRFLLFGIGTGMLFVLGFLFFRPELHMYNLKLKFVRNIILSFAYDKYVWVYALAIMLGWLAIFRMKFEKRSLLLFPFIFASLAPSMLIEQRYYIVPLVFLLFFRKQSDNKTEYALSVWFFLISSALIVILLKFNIFF